MEKDPSLSTGRQWFARRALLFKLLGVGFLALLLLVPLQMVRSTLWERLHRYNQAVDSITAPWGSRQLVAGPILMVPFTHRVERNYKVTRNGEEAIERRAHTERAAAYFLPDSLEVTGDIAPIERNRGIYRTHVYSAVLNVSGTFSEPDFERFSCSEVVPDWENARICFSATDMRGARGVLEIDLDGEAVPFEPGTYIPGLENGVHADVVWSAERESTAFSMALNLNGSGGISFAPVGRETSVALTSAWKDPSFRGTHLPTTRTVRSDGFDAEWNVSYYGRSFGQAWTSETSLAKDTHLLFGDASFGVDLFEPINAYRATERAIKYGVLFVALVFAVFFLFETLADVKLHALNYLLVGGALCLFYLGVLALSEFVSFGAAYAGSGIASVALIGLYCRRILERRSRAWLVSGLIGGVLAYLYFVLQMEDFALLAGTAGLFAVLGAVMYATRGIRSEALQPARQPPPVPDGAQV